MTQISLRNMTLPDELCTKKCLPVIDSMFHHIWTITDI